MQNEMKLETRTSNASTTIEDGLEYILSHFRSQRLWPRTISTTATNGAQVLVLNKEEALARFAQAKFIDCRIAAYPQASKLSFFVGVNLDIAPSIIMIDLDRETFKTQRAFETGLYRTLKEILKTGVFEPTVIWSGSGYHVYLVLEAFVLESVDMFNNARLDSNPSQRFLRFAEWFLSNGKCDPQHNKTVSLRNCMLRIPGSFNSKNGQTVRILRKWNGDKLNIRLLLGSFHAWLVDQRLKESQVRKRTFGNSSSSGKNTIAWIECLLNIPIPDYRKLAIWRIFAPYLLNIRTLSYDQSYNIISKWLDDCNQLKRLDFNPNHRIKNALNSSRRFLPVSCDKLKVENQGFYNLLQERGVLT